MGDVRIIVAVDPNGVIGVGDRMPWHYKADFKRFKERTMGGAVVMGRKTFESIPPTKSGEILPGRVVIVVSKSMPEGPTARSNVVVASSIESAIDAWARGATTWIAGGGEIYRQTLALDDIAEIDYTLVPEVPAEKLAGDVVRFPTDLLSNWTLAAEYRNDEDPRLTHRIYRCTS